LAVRFILYEIWRQLGATMSELPIEPLVRGTWVGGVLRRMQEHFWTVMDLRAIHDDKNDPEKVRVRRLEAKRIRRENHARRLVQKQEQDRIWWQTHQRTSTERKRPEID